MANQPKKYKKFVATAATATLVASAIVPVASAASLSDIAGNTHEEAINALVDAKVISGYPDGTFKPNKTLTRSDVVKLLGKYLVSQGHSIPTDAVSNPRFNDLTSKSNKELLEYAAVVADAGVFAGSNGKLLAGDQITRENMAIVLVRMINTLKDVSLEEFVASQNFNGDVKDLNVAKAEARTAIQVLDFYDITNPSVANFNPKGNTTRGQFATFLHKTINSDFSGAAATTGTVKAINATTVEVTFGEEVEDVKASDFKIEGLEVTNAVAKQGDAKTVVLTTAKQEGKKYTVTYKGNTLGSFDGVSALIPEKITLETTSVQGVVGKEVTLKAFIGVKEKNVPVTFNVDAANDNLNKDIVKEVLTDADGYATFTYTQYNGGTIDDVAVYATGDASKRQFAKVYWGVEPILTVVAEDKKGTTLNNGEKKVYKVTYLNSKTGKPVEGATLNVTFKENVDVTIDKITKATVNGVTPYQLTSGLKSPVTVKTNSKGEATFTVTGSNTKATPVVFVDTTTSTSTANNTLEATELRANADELTFAAIQATYNIEVTRDGGEEAAIGLNNGRKYNVVVKDKDGKVAAGETVNVSFSERLSNVLSSSTNAFFVKDKANAGQQITVKLDKDGKGSFVVASEDSRETDYATPVVWIDINNSNSSTNGKLEEGEPSKVAERTYFVAAKMVGSKLVSYLGTNEQDKFKGTDAATFTYMAVNQSAKAYNPVNVSIEAEFQVYNTGTEDVLILGDNITVSPGRYATVKRTAVQPSIQVTTVGDKTTSVTVNAYGTTTDSARTHLGHQEAKATFTSTKAIGTIHTGVVDEINVDDQELTFVGKTEISYAGATFKNVNGVIINEAKFVELVSAHLDKVTVTVTKDANDKYTFEIVSLDGDVTAALSQVNSAATVTNVVTALENATDSFSPAFSTLKTTAQKTAVAQEILDDRNSSAGRVLTEAGLKTSYGLAYALVANRAAADVAAATDAATVEAALLLVPGLDLSAVTTDNKATVYADTDLTEFNGNTVALLQAAVDKAVADAASAGLTNKVAALNNATTTAGALTALKALEVEGVDLSTFNTLGERPQQLVLADVVAGTYTTVASINSSLRASTTTHKDDVTVNITDIKLAADGNTLTLTFNDDLTLGTALDVAAVADLGITFTDGNVLGTGATATYNSTTDKLVITLGTGKDITSGAVLKTINLTDSLGVVVDITKEAANQVLTVTPVTP